jgi:hypothetical protein
MLRHQSPFQSSAMQEKRPASQVDSTVNEGFSLLDSILSTSAHRPVDKSGHRKAITSMLTRIGQKPERFRNSEYLVKDPTLVFRGDPSYILHDELGFKNNSLPGNIDVIILGNSLVHALSDPYQETWPTLLQGKTNLSIYNGAMGSFSAVQYLLSLRELLFLNPGLVVCSFYTGNNVFNSMITLSHSQPGIVKMFHGYDGSLIRGFENPDVDKYRDIDPEQRVYKFMRLVKNGSSACALAKVRTCPYYLLPRFRRDALDLHNKYIRCGFDIAKQAIERMAKILKKRNIQFLVLIIPTKEYLVHTRHVHFSDVELSSMDELASLSYSEGIVHHELEALCKSNKIFYFNPSIDVASHMNKQLYAPLDLDQHPSLQGKQVFADVMAKYLATVHL